MDGLNISTYLHSPLEYFPYQIRGKLFYRDISVFVHKEMAEIRVGVRYLRVIFSADTAHAWPFLSTRFTERIGRISQRRWRRYIYIYRTRTNFRIWLRSRLDKMAARIPCWRRYIRPLHDAGTNTERSYETAGYTNVHTVVHTNTWVYLSTLFFIIAPSRMRQR